MPDPTPASSESADPDGGLSYEQAVAGPAGPAPVRRADSVRRTSTIDMTWPGGMGTQLRLEGTARDAVTLDPAEPPVVVDAARTWVGVDGARTIVDIRSEPDRGAGLQRLVGCRGGGYLRAAIDECLPGERSAGTPLYLLLDDISGTSLIAGFAWSRWTELWADQARDRPRVDMEGVCIGFRSGSQALVEVRTGVHTHRTQYVAPLVHADDPYGWHDLGDLPPVSMRRARRIDVWREGDTVHVDSAFQDSAGDRTGTRVAVHEYGLRATADAATLTLQTVTPDARILPFMECPSAVATAQQVVGTPLVDLRAVVLERLSKDRGCTHLNDALRALAEVPVLLHELDDALAEHGRHRV